MWFIGDGVEQETTAPPPEKNPGSAPVSAAFNSTDSKVSQFYSKLNHRKVLLGSSDLNGCTRGFRYCFCKCIHNEKLLRYYKYNTKPKSKGNHKACKE